MKFLSSSFWKRYSTRCLCWLITIGCYLYLGSRRHLITGMSQKISGRQHLYKCWLLRQLDFELLACNLKINKVRLLSRVNNCTKFSNSGSGAKRSKDIERSSINKQFDKHFDFGLRDLKINREYIYSLRTININDKFVNSQAK